MTPRARPSLASRLAARGLPATAVVGVRFALEPGRGRAAVPVRAAIATAAAALALVLGRRDLLVVAVREPRASQPLRRDVGHRGGLHVDSGGGRRLGRQGPGDSGCRGLRRHGDVGVRHPVRRDPHGDAPPGAGDHCTTYHRGQGTWTGRSRRSVPSRCKSSTSTSATSSRSPMPSRDRGTSRSRARLCSTSPVSTCPSPRPGRALRLEHAGPAQSGFRRVHRAVDLPRRCRARPYRGGGGEAARAVPDVDAIRTGRTSRPHQSRRRPRFCRAHSAQSSPFSASGQLRTPC